jgi:hypothetical protein
MYQTEMVEWLSGLRRKGIKQDMKKFYKMPSIGLCLVFVFFTVCLMLLSGCATAPEMDDPKALERLAEQYWTKRLVEKDYKFTYNLELEKKSLSFSEYCERLKASGKFKYLSVKTKEVTIEGDKGFVYLTIECRMPFLRKPYALPINDVWLYESNRWKHKFTHK